MEKSHEFPRLFSKRKKIEYMGEIYIIVDNLNHRMSDTCLPIEEIRKLLSKVS